MRVDKHSTESDCMKLTMLQCYFLLEFTIIMALNTSGLFIRMNCWFKAFNVHTYICSSGTCFSVR